MHDTRIEQKDGYLMFSTEVGILEVGSIQRMISSAKMKDHSGWAPAEQEARKHDGTNREK
jgi:hypothetical protein